MSHPSVSDAAYRGLHAFRRYRQLEVTFGSHIKLFLLMGRRHAVRNYLFNMNNYAYGDSKMNYFENDHARIGSALATVTEHSHVVENHSEAGLG